jgi:hypothetical protein
MGGRLLGPSAPCSHLGMRWDAAGTLESKQQRGSSSDPFDTKFRLLGEGVPRPMTLETWYDAPHPGHLQDDFFFPL